MSGIRGIVAREGAWLSDRLRGSADHDKLSGSVFHQFSSYCGFRVMESDGSPAGPSTSCTSPSLTDLKGIEKDSLRELLRDEPARKTGRGSRGAQEEMRQEVSTIIAH